MRHCQARTNNHNYYVKIKYLLGVYAGIQLRGPLFVPKYFQSIPQWLVFQ